LHELREFFIPQVSKNQRYYLARKNTWVFLCHGKVPHERSYTGDVEESGTIIIDTETAPETSPVRRSRARKRKLAETAETVLPPAETPEVPIIEFTPAECAFLYAVLGEVESQIAALVSKCPLELARKFWSFSPGEVAALAQPTSKVLTKHGGAFLAKYHDEVVLAVALISVHQRKITDFAAALAEHRRQLRAQAEATRPAKPNGPESIEVKATVV
jgi:hypothetical protein